MRDLTTALAGQVLLAADPAKAGIDKLDGPTRARVLAALAALVILGFGLVLLVWMGARYTRRYMGFGPSGPSGSVRTDDWVRRSKDDAPKSNTP
jgi:hypothetical protein